jgi:acyl-CoA reductase-like NAD-dependent aldehyde dehydrogenase
MAAFKILLVAMKAQQGWKRIPPERRRAILEVAQSSAKKHGPTVARAVRDQGPTVARAVKDQGPTVAKQLGRALREAAKKRP